MAAVCCYFQVHQPYRLRGYSFFDIGRSDQYFDDEVNRAVMQRVAERCYVPANRCLLRAIKQFGGRFKVAFSISGTAIEQMRMYAPAALETFKELADTGCVEFLGETYYHSLSALYDRREFEWQVREHSRLMQAEFNTLPRVLRNTELIYNDEIGLVASELGFEGILAEGVSDVLGWRSPNVVYCVPDCSTRLLLRNFKLSDDISFRYPELRTKGDAAASIARSIHKLSDTADVVGLFMDYETFGEHHREDSGIFDLLAGLPGAILRDPEWGWMTPTEAIRTCSANEVLRHERTTSWADSERDTSAWCGNRMQRRAIEVTRDPSAHVRGRMCEAEFSSVVTTLRRLQTSDHFYYMSTKGAGDGEVHRYFSPFPSPYEAFVTYMNVTRDITERSIAGTTDGASTMPLSA